MSAGEHGYATEACTDCGAEANSWHYPGCPEAPDVCPGCYAIDDEACAGYCPDRAIALAREASELDDDYERDDLNDSNDWEWSPDHQEGA